MRPADAHASCLHKDTWRHMWGTWHEIDYMWIAATLMGTLLGMNTTGTSFSDHREKVYAFDVRAGMSRDRRAARKNRFLQMLSQDRPRPLRTQMLHGTSEVVEETRRQYATEVRDHMRTMHVLPELGMESQPAEDVDELGTDEQTHWHVYTDGSMADADGGRGVAGWGIAVGVPGGRRWSSTTDH